MNFKKYHVSKNLFDKYAEYTVGQTAYKYTISGLTPNQKYTCSTNFVAETGKEAAIYFNGGSTGTNGVDYRSPKTFTCGSSGTMTVHVRFQSTSQSNPAIYDDLMNGTIWIMINEGSQPLPYEPYSSEVWTDIPHYIHNTSTDTFATLPAIIYANDTTVTVGLKGDTQQTDTPSPSSLVDVVGVGESETIGEHSGQYKIPILCGNQTINIYLGETQSTRAVKKLVLTGEENWEQQSGQTVDYFRISNMAALPSKVFCTHFLSPDTDINYASTVTGIKMQQSSSYGVILACRPPNVTGLANFKSFLATQYANGTPVTIWYVLATPETAVVNEPLCKIGDYADTVSGITIPTIAGANTVDVLTTLKPSEVSVNYHGWHPVQSVHEAENGAWT